jgi:hypothetical protein
MRAVALALALLAAAVHTSGIAAACQCDDGGLDDHVKAADAIFIATIDDVAVTRDKQVRHRATVEGVWKGGVAKRVELIARGAMGCTYPRSLGKGTRWVVFVKGDGPAYALRMCSGLEPATREAIAAITAKLGRPRATR